jgi:hypothetical protein
MALEINVIQGVSAAGCLQQTIRPRLGGLLVHQDELTCGPLSTLNDIERWRDLRLSYWNSVLPDGEALYGPFEGDLTGNAAALRNAESIVAWVGSGSAEQLFLAWLAEFLVVANVSAPLRVIQFIKCGNRTIDAWSLGMVNPDQMRMHPEPLSIPSDDIEELRRCWRCVTEPEPTALLSFLSEQSTSMPLLRPALRPLLDRYPDHVTGLGRWDMALLRNVKDHGPHVTRVIGQTIGDRCDADMIGDLYLFARLRRLAVSSLREPLVTLTGDPMVMRHCEATLTDSGRNVLDGRLNAVQLNGVDDWVLGVHLDSTNEAVWYRKPEGVVRATKANS